MYDSEKYNMISHLLSLAFPISGSDTYKNLPNTILQLSLLLCGFHSDFFFIYFY